MATVAYDSRGSVEPFLGLEQSASRTLIGAYGFANSVDITEAVSMAGPRADWVWTAGFGKTATEGDVRIVAEMEVQS